MAAKPISVEDLDHILARTRPIWEEMRGQSIFITGGTGFFGCWLVESFCYVNRALSLDARATVLSRDPTKFAAKCSHLASDPAVTLHAGDVRDFAFPAGKFAYVIHAATEASAKQAAEEPLEMLSTILAGTERTLKFAAECGAKKFLLTSSGAVYGKLPGDMTHVPESYMGAPDPVDAASVYAEGKRASELMCALHQKAAQAKGLEFEAKIARCWAFCGPHLPLDTHFAIGNFIGDVLAGRPIAIGGDGTPRRSYLYGSDLAIWLWTMLFRAPALTPINVGSAHDVSILELAGIVAATLDPATQITVARQPVAGAAPARYVPSVARAEELLGLHETVSLEDSIRRTAAWYVDSGLRNACRGDTEEVREGMKLISIVSPCYNEEGNVGVLTDRVRELFAEMPQYRYEHIIIDNNSTDGTVAELREIAARDKHVKVIVNARNFGHIRSPQHALMEAQGDAVIVLLSDLQDPPELIKDFLHEWEAGWPIVVAIKTTSEESGLMYGIRSAYYKTVAQLTNVKVFEHFTGFGLYDRKVMDILRKDFRDPNPYFRGQIAEIGLPSKTIPYNQKRRTRGITKNNWYTLYDMAMLGITNLSKVPLRAVIFFGFVCAVLSLIAGFVYLIAKLLFWNHFELGLAPTMIGLFFLGSVQLVSLGIIGEYVGSIHSIVQNRPLVTEKERINF